MRYEEQLVIETRYITVNGKPQPVIEPKMKDVCTKYEKTTEKGTQ